MSTNRPHETASKQRSRVWDWELSYISQGSRRHGALGRTSTPERATARIDAILAELPPGTVAHGQITLMGKVPLIGDRPTLRTVAQVERTADDQVIWSSQ